MFLSTGTILHLFLHVVLFQVVIQQLDLSSALQESPPSTTPTRRQVVQSLTLAGGIVATTKASSSPSAATVTFSKEQPGPLLRLKLPSAPGENSSSSSKNKILAIPRVGYSLYKTATEQVPDGVRLALQAGVRYFDVATQYGTNEQVGAVLQDYIQNGLDGNASRARTISSKRAQEARRKELFIAHKVSNAEQSLDRAALHKSVLTEANRLGKNNLDLVMIHSPLTNKQQRLATYESLLELQQAGKVQAVGVCNYGVSPLQEIVEAGFPAPAVIQLILSPFNQHKDVAAWAAEYGSVLQCSAWSALSSKGPEQGWAVVADLAKKRGMTKAQVLVRWAVQKGFLCVPRSSSKFKIERQAIAENSWNGTSSFLLSQAKMDILDGLDEQIPAGRLGIVDGWDKSAIVNDQWDPTTAV